MSPCGVVIMQNKIKKKKNKTVLTFERNKKGWDVFLKIFFETQTSKVIV